MITVADGIRERLCRFYDEAERIWSEWRDADIPCIIKQTSDGLWLVKKLKVRRK